MNEIKVLIADDEVDFLESLSKVLKRRNIAVEKAFNGEEALNILSKTKFDVIVLDLRMPVLDGLATLKKIRETDRITPILLLSGHADLSFVTDALRNGAADYLLKPVSVESLVAAIETSFERKNISVDFSEKTSSR